MNRVRCAVAFLVALVAAVIVFAAAPEKSKKPAVKQLPPTTAPLPDAVRKDLEAGVAKLGHEIEALRAALKGKPQLLALLPDVQIFHKAVQWPLLYQEATDVKRAQAALLAGLQRAADLRGGKAPWVVTGGPRGYVSRLDGSVQPYLLAMPKDYDPAHKGKYRVDLFCHGRGEDLMELKFISGKNADPLPGKFYVQPYGRYCCANKLAGEIDSLEILDSLRKQYPIDDDRIVMMGFSMGGGAAWHFAVHYSDLWVAASPGAGFCDLPQYQRLAETGELETFPWWERKLFHYYDCDDWVVNLNHCPTIAYAGELDAQAASGAIMEKAAAAEGVPLERIVGPKTGHKYEPGAKAELDRRLDEIAARGRQRVPQTVRMATWTLRYNHVHWVIIEGLEHHWEQARVTATIADKTRDRAAIEVQQAQNVTALTLRFDPGLAPFPAGSRPVVRFDGQEVATAAATPVGADGSWEAAFHRAGSRWEAGRDPAPLRKRPGLQGPIDDALLDRFLFVSPTGRPMNAKVGQWCKAEMEHAQAQWRGIFRGDAPVKRDDEVTEAELAGANLVLWGDPSSNRILARLAKDLPISWTASQITVGSERFATDHHALVMVYPRGTSGRYVVLNSGFTFRETANSTNSRQVPRLPDYAVIDLNTPPDANNPGAIPLAGFFGERWELLTDHGRGKEFAK